MLQFNIDRTKVQAVIDLITIVAGIHFSLYISSIAYTVIPVFSKPQAVDGFLPIGSLIALKYYFIAGVFDLVHPAGMVILFFAIMISFLFKKAFCSWFCPVGTLSEWLWKLGHRLLGENFLPPKWLDIPLRSLKYLLMYFFVMSVLKMDQGQMASFLDGQYWKIADVKMLSFFINMSRITMMVLIIMAIASLFIRNFWCRYLCPYGGFLAIFSFISPSRVMRNESTCTNCGLCAKACPAYLPVDKKPYIISAECTGCIACTESCPINMALQFETFPMKPSFWTSKRLTFIILGSFLILVIVAKASGVWDSNTPTKEIIELLPYLESIAH